MVLVAWIASARAAPASHDAIAQPTVPERAAHEAACAPAGDAMIVNGVVQAPDCALGPTADLEPYHGVRCGMIVVVYAFFYGIFLLCWAAFVAGRAGLVKRYPPQPVSLLVAEGVTTRQLRWYALWATMQVVGVIGLSAADSDGLAIMLAPFAFTTLVRLALARRVRRMLERADTTAARHGRWLVVTSPDASAKLWASNQDFVQAARAGIPRSIAR
jgi:hypothetical protein